MFPSQASEPAFSLLLPRDFHSKNGIGNKPYSFRRIHESIEPEYSPTCPRQPWFYLVWTEHYGFSRFQTENTENMFIEMMYFTLSMETMRTQEDDFDELHWWSPKAFQPSFINCSWMKITSHALQSSIRFPVCDGILATTSWVNIVHGSSLRNVSVEVDGIP